MELVYLWVEDYKNIKKQGFSFSPKLNCHYDEDSNELSINENDDYIENFFGENINVTAIVGKNGSGKSNLFESLICIIEKNVVSWSNYKICAVFYNQDEKEFFIKNINFPISIKGQTNQSTEDMPKRLEVKSPFLFHYNYTLESMDNKEHNIDFDKLYHKTDNYSTPILLQPNKVQNKIHLDMIDYLAQQDILSYAIRGDIIFEHIKKFFVPYTIDLAFDYYNIHKDIVSEKSEIIENIKYYFRDHDDLIYNLNQLSKNDLIFLTKQYIIRKTITSNLQDTIKNTEYKESILSHDDIEGINIIMDEYLNNEFDVLYNETYPYRINKIKQCFNFINYLNRQNDEYKLPVKNINIKENKELLENIPPWIDIDFYTRENISFTSLSYGQKFLIKFLYSLINQLNNLDSHTEYTKIILLLDEVELGLHPQWQKEYLSLLIDILKRYENRYDFHVICSTHSPFILSDVAKENVLFLDTYEKEKTKEKYPKLDIDGLEDRNCINVSKHIDINPFGANIHTLLSDGFFMDEGLMGEFAKGKIQEIVNFYNGVKDGIKKKKDYIKVKKEFYFIQKQIGEKYLKNVIQNHIEFIEKELGDKSFKEKKKKQLLAELKDLGFDYD